MRSVLRSLAPLAALLATLALAGCGSDEERAQAHFERAQALAAEGDTARAVLEYRNVFRLDGNNVAARMEYARLLRDTGDVRGAYAQYLRLVEQEPANVAGLTALAELALETGDFETAGQHVEAAFVLAPADMTIQALKATVDYRTGDRKAALAMAGDVTAAMPGNVAAQMVLIAEAMNTANPEGALEKAEAALTHAPEDEGLHILRLAALEELGDIEGSGEELRTMAALFPENDNIHQALIQWHLRAGDQEGAEDALRAKAALSPEDPQAALEVVQFLIELEGEDAARTELERLVAAKPEEPGFRQALAGLDFAGGREAEAVAALRTLIDAAEPSDATRELQVGLAGMLDATGETAERDTLLDSVLDADPAHVAALKLRARGHIAADRPERAIQDMRAATAQAPRDPEVMTIMAKAHERQGARELASEQLARAVEAANQAPAESLRYARFLMTDGRVGPAEGVIADALRRTPGNRELLGMLGQIHIARRDWPRVRQVAAALREPFVDAPTDAAELQESERQAAEAMANRLEMAALRGQGESGEVVAKLEEIAGTEGGNTRAMAELVQAHAAAGDFVAAQTQLDALTAADPENPQGRMLQAGLYTLQGELDRAEEIWVALVAEAPALPGPYQALFALRAGSGRDAEALNALDAGIEAAETDADLLFTKAGFLETLGDIDGAIAVYETLYARDSASNVVANNLASLIATYRNAAPADDAAAPIPDVAVDDSTRIERAYVIARRLRGSDVPQFQDTYGWIAHLRGDSDAALTALEPAARALPGDALVQFHLAEVQFAKEAFDAARASYTRTLDAADASGGATAALPQIDVARARIAEIDARPAPGIAPDAASMNDG